jgi:transposase InsO family protein
MIDELLDLQVIQPSKATAWSQAHLVRKPKGGWRFTIDYRGLNKVMSNEGWQIPNMRDMLERIGSHRPRRFAIADLTSGFFQMPLHPACQIYTAFITFRGIYEWTRVPMGLLPSANFFQKSMSTYVLHGLLYSQCEVYIDDVFLCGVTDDALLEHARKVFQRFREKRVTLNPLKVEMGADKVQFVGHEIDAEGLNMSQKRIEGTIAFIQPRTVKELQSFLGLVNYFRDHLQNHSMIAYPLHQMLTAATKAVTKTITWTEQGTDAFYKLKDLVNKCPKLYFIDYNLKIILYTDASDYAHGAYLCQLRPSQDGASVEEPIRFLSGTFHGPQVRWSTIEKEAYAIHFALLKMDDLLGGVPFTIRTDHRNLLFMNNHGSRKVAQWKLDIQHYNATIEHVAGVANIPADVFSRLVTKVVSLPVHPILTLSCTSDQRALIEKFHTYLHAHYGVERTILLLTQHEPDLTNSTVWPNLRHDVRQFVQSCPTCQKMDARHQVIRASRFVLSSLRPMERIAIDTIGPMDEDMGFKYIIVIIDTFTRYVELFAKQDVTALAAADALFRHCCRFTTPLELVTDFGSQFVNQLLSHFNEMTGIKHHTTIPYSKEENGIVERANKEVNRHIRNILFDKGHFKNWSRMLCMTERILNTSIKQPLGASPNTLLFGTSFMPDRSLLKTIDMDITANKPRSIRDYVDSLISRQHAVIDAAIQSQIASNEDNLRKRYAKYKRVPSLRQPIHQPTDNQGATTNPISIAHIFTEPLPTKPPIIAATKWIPYTNPVTGESEYVRVLQSEEEIIDTIDEIDSNPYMLTTYAVNDYVLRCYPPSKLGGGNPHKYGSWWRGPYQVTKVSHKTISGSDTKPMYTIRNLADNKEYVVDVTHLRPFFFDPEFVNPLNVAAKDTGENVVVAILRHDFSDLNDKRWLVRWEIDGVLEESWETYDNLKNVEVFQHYCASHQLDPFLPKPNAPFSASNPNLMRHGRRTFPVPSPPLQDSRVSTIQDNLSPMRSSRKRGRPRKHG